GDTHLLPRPWPLPRCHNSRGGCLYKKKQDVLDFRRTGKTLVARGRLWLPEPCPSPLLSHPLSIEQSAFEKIAYVSPGQRCRGILFRTPCWVLCQQRSELYGQGARFDSHRRGNKQVLWCFRDGHATLLQAIGSR